MIISDISIKRPVLAAVLSLMIILAGISGYLALPVREYPDIENPVVSIRTVYSGASPETIESTLTEPLETVLSGIRDIRTITSISSYGVSSIDIEFETTRNIDTAATDVTNAIQSALGRIPQDAEKPVISKAGANSDAIMWLGVLGENYSAEELSNIADRIIKPSLQIVPGVGSVLIGGQRKYAMRIWLDPKKMAARNVDINEVKDALTKNNIQLPAGQIKGETRQFNVLANGLLVASKEFENIVVKNENGISVYIKDIGKAELGSENYDSIALYNSRQIVGIGIVKQSTANELKVAELVKNELPKIREALPNGILLKVAVDRSIFIRESLSEALFSLLLAFLLVIAVTMLFLRSAMATIITSFSIPISIIGAFALMYLLGYSVNVLTMLAMILAIGIVVDDAIVVLENIYRRQELGEDGLIASFRGTREVGFPVIATTLCLIAVFIPLSMLQGKTGRLFNEFSISIAIAVAISSFVALTLIPALCSKYLKTQTHKEHLNPLVNLYDIFSKKAVQHHKLIAIFLIVNLIASIGIFYVLPKTFVPVEDRGSILTIVKAPQGSTLAYTKHYQSLIEKEIGKIPEVTGYFSAIGLSIGGAGNPSNGIVFASLKHWKERKEKQQNIVASLFQKFSKVPGIFAFPINMPSLGQRTFGKDIEFVIKGSSDLNELIEISNHVIEKFKNIPGLINVDSDLLFNTPQLDITFNRAKAADLGIPIIDIARTIQSSLAESKVNDFILNNKQYDVITSLIPNAKSKPGDIKNIYIKNTNKLVPLESIVDVKPTVAPSQINHFDLQRSVTITASLLHWCPLGRALKDIKSITKRELKSGFSTALSGISREYAESSTALYFAFLISLLFIYLTLAAVFESFIHPITILLSVPLALLGALGTLFITGQSINIYSQIGILLLIGLVTKNSILIVDYANQHRARGIELVEAIHEACKIRFRPILMTATTMILGTLPLVFAQGAGAEGRISLGLVIVGGLIFSTVFTLFVIPAIYKIVVSTAERLNIKTIPPATKIED